MAGLRCIPLTSIIITAFITFINFDNISCFISMSLCSLRRVQKHINLHLDIWEDQQSRQTTDHIQELDVDQYISTKALVRTSPTSNCPMSQSAPAFLTQEWKQWTVWNIWKWNNIYLKCLIAPTSCVRSHLLIRK
jgi:hypothetical protein